MGADSHWYRFPRVARQKHRASNSQRGLGWRELPEAPSCHRKARSLSPNPDRPCCSSPSFPKHRGGRGRFGAGAMAAEASGGPGEHRPPARAVPSPPPPPHPPGGTVPPTQLRGGTGAAGVLLIRRLPPQRLRKGCELSGGVIYARVFGLK